MINPIRLEAHVHTRFSKDSMLCFWPLYLRLCAKKISVIAVTEHNNIEGGKRFAQFCKKRGGKISVIVGEEIFTSHGEIIGLFLNEPIDPGLSPEETISSIEQQNGVVYIPHPFDLKRKKTVLQECAISSNREHIDCIEIHNGRNVSPDFSTRQLEIARKYNLRQVVGSDAHTFIEAGRNYMLVKNIPHDRESFIDAINDAQFVKAECIPISHTITAIVKMLKLMKGGEFGEVHKLIVRRLKKYLHK